MLYHFSELPLLLCSHEGLELNCDISLIFSSLLLESIGPTVCIYHLKTLQICTSRLLSSLLRSLTGGSSLLTFCNRHAVGRVAQSV